MPSWCMDMERMRGAGKWENEQESEYVCVIVVNGVTVDQHAKLWTKTIWLDSWEYLRCVVLSVSLMLAGWRGGGHAPPDTDTVQPSPGQVSMAPATIGHMTLCGHSPTLPGDDHTTTIPHYLLISRKVQVSLCHVCDHNRDLSTKMTSTHGERKFDNKRVSFSDLGKCKMYSSLILLVYDWYWRVAVSLCQCNVVHV